MVEKKNKKNTDADVQATLWGTAVKEGDELSWISVGTEVKQVGDSLTFALDSATWNDEKECLTAFNGEGAAIGIHDNHSEQTLAMAEKEGWTLSQTDGERFGRAFFTAGLLDGTVAANRSDSFANMAAIINGTPGITLTVEMIEMSNGNSYRRWTIA
jgi:hypothetical protein